MINVIHWNLNPEIFSLSLGEITIPFTWYGVCFALAFLLAQQLLYYIFRQDNKPQSDVDTLTIYGVVAIIVGARLGHYLFYEWELLFHSPRIWIVNLVTPPFAGLASHGATIAFLIALYLYARKKGDQSFLWVTDRVVIVVSLGGALVRLGNLLNSEIYGSPTSLPWGFIFERETDPDLLPLVPRHPTQIYESLFCLVLLAITFYLWKTKPALLRDGMITGIFILLLFSFRFVVEFLKNDQVNFESGMWLNMGQILSIPAVLFGMGILFVAFRKKATMRV